MATRHSPFVSIIIPTFNSGRKLDTTLGTCLKIRGVDVEILLIDDGSTDGTPERVERTYPTVKVYRLSSNSGSGAKGRNIGLAMARGNYVKFLDHDDLIQPRGFKAECREALQSNADIVMSRWGVAHINDRGLFRKQDLRILTPPEPSRLLEAILHGESTPYTAAALYKRSLIRGEHWDANQTLIDDFDWFCRMAIKDCKVTRVDTISYFWRLHSDSTQARSLHHETLYQDLTFARYNVFKKLEEQLEARHQLSEFHKKLLAQRYYGTLRCFARYDAQGCRKILEKIYRLDPGFEVDASCEQDQWALWLIQRMGLSAFLRFYGAIVRLGDSVPLLRDRTRRLVRRPEVRARDRG